MNDNDASYRIILDGYLDKAWMNWFECERMESDKGRTILIVHAKDQAGLYGILLKVLNIGISLISLERIE